MLLKKRRTLELYKSAGAKMRLYKSIGEKLVMEISCVLSASDTEKLMRAMDKINEVCSRAEDNMFNDHPEISDEYVDVFYGAVSDEPRNDLDAEMVQRARKAADDVFHA